MRNSGFLKIFVILFLSLIFIEFAFKIFEFKSLIEFSSIRIILFSLTLISTISFIISFMSNKAIKIIMTILIFFFGFYPYLQMGFLSLMGNYMSFNAAGDGAMRILEYVGLFFANNRLISYILFIPFIIYLYIVFKIKPNFKSERSALENVLILLIIMFIYTLSLMSLKVTPSGQIVNNENLFKEPKLISLSLRQFGATQFMIRDFVNIFIDYEEELNIIIDEKEEEEETDYTRYIDDSDWETLIENETNSKIKALHQFYLNQRVTPKNDYTGLFKDKNLILIMVEAFDYLAINEEVTPTLYKLKNEGWFFDNYYAPKYSCTTGESEYIGLTSIIPSPTVCTPNTYVNNNYETAIFNIFNKSNYYSSSYHNWTDQFYERSKLHKNMGSSEYYDYDGLKIKPIIGWPSDLDMMEKAIPKFIDEDKFFSFMITSSMHFPYDSFVGVVQKNWNKVKDLPYPMQVKYYLAKSIEFDLAMKHLLDTLESQNILDDTVIVLFGDHHPYHMSLSYLKEYSGIDRNENLNIDKSPFIIYNSKQKPEVISKTSSTFDIVPTLANLFDLDFDPRYYIGKDIFSDEETIVIFTTGSWVTDKAIYISSLSKHVKLDDSVTEDYLFEINRKVRDYINVSESTLVNNYFKYRFKK